MMLNMSNILLNIFAMMFSSGACSLVKTLDLLATLCDVTMEY